MKPVRGGFNTISLSKHGFTLIELLVVIAILAVLSVVGFAVFNGLSKGARDSKRKADIDALAKAYEIKYSNSYQALSVTDFSGGNIPQDPQGYDYYNVIGSGGSGFKVCAKLEDYGGAGQFCNTPSALCVCKLSGLGNIPSGSSISGSGSEIGLGGSNNLINNPSFESGSTGWTFYLYPAGGASGNGSVSNEKSYFENNSYKLIDTGGTGEVAINYSGLNFIVGRRYRISGWVYSTTARGAIQGHFGGGWGVDSFTVNVPIANLNNWYQLSITRVAAAVTPALRCGAFGSGSPGTVYCDGIDVEEVP